MASWPQPCRLPKRKSVFRAYAPLLGQYVRHAASRPTPAAKLYGFFGDFRRVVMLRALAISVWIRNPHILPNDPPAADRHSRKLVHPRLNRRITSAFRRTRNPSSSAHIWIAFPDSITSKLSIVCSLGKGFTSGIGLIGHPHQCCGRWPHTPSWSAG